MKNITVLCERHMRVNSCVELIAMFASNKRKMIVVSSQLLPFLFLTQLAVVWHLTIHIDEKTHIEATWRRPRHVVVRYLISTFFKQFLLPPQHHCTTATPSPPHYFLNTLVNVQPRNSGSFYVLLSQFCRAWGLLS